MADVVIDAADTASSANTLFAALSAKGRAKPDAPFAHLPSGTTLSHGDMLAGSARLANALVALGVAPGDRVAVQVDKSIENLMLYLATVRAGGVYLPLNTAYTPAEIEYFLTDAEPALFVCDPTREAALGPVAEAAGARLRTLDAEGGGTLIEAADRASQTFDDVPRAADDLAAILYTSGTTGRSKGAMLSHRNLFSNSATLVDVWRFTSDDVLIHALPIFHTHGLFVATNCVLLSGASLHFLPKFDASAVLALMPQTSVLMGVPTFYTRLLGEPELGAASKDMRLFVSGSAPLLAETHDAFRTATGHAILERYGMTETNMNTSNPYDGARRAGTVGFPLPDVELRITDPDAKIAAPSPQGEVGMIEVRGPNVFQGYWRMPEKTAEELREDGFFITGDLGLVDDQGYVQIVGRGKDLIISGGFNVYPKEVETVIDEMDGVVESAVIGVPHPDFGEGVVAIVVPKAGTDTKAETIIAALKDTLARYKQPKHIAFIDALPRNTMGKVQKNVLRERFADVLKSDA